MAINSAYKRRRESGLVQVTVWVPSWRVKGIKAWAERFCWEHINKVKIKYTWRTCPCCLSRVSKILSATTGNYTCQMCGHEYNTEESNGD